jgi:hypothetical protein
VRRRRRRRRRKQWTYCHCCLLLRVQWRLAKGSLLPYHHSPLLFSFKSPFA